MNIVLWCINTWGHLAAILEIERPRRIFQHQRLVEKFIH